MDFSGDDELTYGSLVLVVVLPPAWGIPDGCSLIATQSGLTMTEMDLTPPCRCATNRKKITTDALQVSADRFLKTKKSARQGAWKVQGSKGIALCSLCFSKEAGEDLACTLITFGE